MTPTNPIAFVRYYNAWRVGGDMDQPEPTAITRMLTELCDHAERLERELAACRHETMLLEAELEKFYEKAISWWCEYQDLKAKAGDDRSELKQIKSILADPLAVHLNMMRGTIKWTPANLRQLLGDS